MADKVFRMIPLNSEDHCNEGIDLSVIAYLGIGEKQETLVAQISDFVARLYPRYEIIFFRDYSEDSREIAMAPNGDPHVVRFASGESSSEYGQALLQAIRMSRGDSILTLDPLVEMNLPDLLQLYRSWNAAGADLVNGYRIRSRKPRVRLRTDVFLNQVASHLFDLKVRDYACPVKLFRGEIARSISIDAKERRLVLAEITLKLHALGARVAECPVVARQSAEKSVDRKWTSRIREAKATWLFLFFLSTKIKLFKAGVLQSLSRADCPHSE